MYQERKGGFALILPKVRSKNSKDRSGDPHRHCECVEICQFCYSFFVNVTSIHAFSEKVALISDISDAVGRATALQLGLQGAYVIGGLPSGTTDDGSIAELASLGTIAKAVEYESPAELKATVDATFGRLDLLVNCLKFLPKSDFIDDGEKQFEAYFADNVRQMYLLTDECVGLMKDRPKPKIVNVVTRFDGENNGNALFRASQDAIISLTKALSDELPGNFRCNAVSIPFAADEMDPSELFVKPGGFAPDDAARAILYLLSSESVAINGRLIELG